MCAQREKRHEERFRSILDEWGEEAPFRYVFKDSYNKHKILHK